VESLTEPPAGCGGLVGNSVLFDVDKAVVCVEDVLLHGHDCLDDEGERAHDREGVLAHIREAQREVLVVRSPVTLEHRTTEQEKERLTENETDRDDGEAAAVDYTLGDRAANHLDRRNNHPVRNVLECSHEEQTHNS